eukprot:CAMPEP_0176153086 /NCGR_PEP_ID=MMETSP0120_2-20121206/78191_1 /TAXON_ID=160619 /ORGANISM="Kryptoperidinium foliaceum, Strain CCMP 1326" /LENGTH=78 /DNA_ID=CAMNT_0017490115 /DNA_START=106 /DNA_END=343 /DNA_ORIENTATION=+
MSAVDNVELRLERHPLAYEVEDVRIGVVVAFEALRTTQRTKERTDVRAAIAEGCIVLHDSPSKKSEARVQLRYDAVAG